MTEQPAVGKQQSENRRGIQGLFPPTAENVFDKQHLKHVRKETVCLLECDFLGSRISP